MSATAQADCTGSMTCLDVAQEHATELWLVAQWLAESTEEAEDLTRQTLIAGCRDFDPVGPVADLRTRLLGIMVDLYQHRRPSGEMWTRTGVGCAVWAGENSAGEPGGGAVTDRGVGPAGLERAVRQLPDSLRIPVLLADVLNLSYHEIAHVVGIPAGAVRSRISRGRSLLLATLGSSAGSGASDSRLYSQPYDSPEPLSSQL